MKRNRKYQLHDNPSVGGLEHTFASVRICSRINHTVLLSGKPEWFGSIYDIPTRRFMLSEEQRKSFISFVEYSLVYGLVWT